MKTHSIIVLSLFSLCFCSLSFSQESKYGLSVRAGMNYSDANYGIESLQSLFPIEDYPLYSSGGGPAFGYQFGVAGSAVFGKRWELFTNFDFMRLNYDVTSAVFDIDSIPTGRPVRPDVPVIISGNVGYHYLVIETGLRYSFNDDVTKGMFVGVSISDMFHLSTTWRFDVKYETQQIDERVDLSDNQEGLEFTNPFMLGLHTGYHLKVKENFSIAPIVDFRLGLSPVVDLAEEILNPQLFSLTIQGQWWF